MDLLPTREGTAKRNVLAIMLIFSVWIRRFSKGMLAIDFALVAQVFVHYHFDHETNVLSYCNLSSYFVRMKIAL